jgi:hypothetical protein
MTPIVSPRPRTLRPKALNLQAGACGIRAAIVALAGLTTLLVPDAGSALFTVAGAGALLAAAAPARSGALVVLGADLLGWMSAYGTDTTAPILRTVLFATALYLLHSATALAASVPVRAHVSADVVRTWATRCLPGIGSAVVAGAAVAVIGQAPGSTVLDVVGLGVALCTVGGLAWLTRPRR